MRCVDLGLVEYGKAHNLQKKLVDFLVQNPAEKDVCLIAEHKPVFTLGRNGTKDHLMIPEEILEQKGVDLVHVERGGEITYHGPGQCVVYPLIALKRAALSVACYVDLLEEVMLQTASDVGVNVGRDDRNSGVWLGDNKVGSIGIAIRKGITYHGMALNVSLDLEPFSWMNPCGLSGVGVSSLERERGIEIDMKQVKESMQYHFCRLLKRDINTISYKEITSIT